MIEKPARNLWPFGILLAFAFFLLGTAGLIVIACSHKMDLVSPDYYEQEIRYQSRLEQANRALELGSQATVTYNQQGCLINIVLPTAPFSQKPNGTVLLYRPSAARLDRQIQLELDSKGTQQINAAGLEPGLWKVRVFWSVKKQEYFIDRSIVVAQR
jgi:hypothetical protein